VILFGLFLWILFCDNLPSAGWLCFWIIMHWLFD
jgi:hypothetical protein